jgi:hypothetical protein
MQFNMLGRQKRRDIAKRNTVIGLFMTKTSKQEL